MSQKREISPFICRELLYDYITGHLDHSRSTAVEECLEKFEEIKEDVQSIKSAISFCENLKKIQIPESIFTPLLEQTEWLQNIKGKWDEVPTTIRVTLGTLCLATMFLFILQSPSVKNWGKEGELVTVALNTKAQKEKHDLLHQEDTSDTSKSSIPSNKEVKFNSSTPSEPQNSSKQDRSSLSDTHSEKPPNKKQDTIKGLEPTKDSKTISKSLKLAQKTQPGSLKQKNSSKKSAHSAEKQKSAKNLENPVTLKSPPAKKSETPDQKEDSKKQATNDKQKSIESSATAKSPSTFSKKPEASDQKSDPEKQTVDNKQKPVKSSTTAKVPLTPPSPEQLDSSSDLSQKASPPQTLKTQTHSQKSSDKKQELADPDPTEGSINTKISDKTPSESSQVPSTKLSDKPSTTLKEKKSELKGLLVRVFLDVTQLDQTTSKVVSKIKNLEGKKAGRVPLGWKRKRDRYFHFSLPESNESTLIEYLKGLGSVRIIRDPHRRIMPKGTLRFILLIKKKTNNGNQEEQKSTSKTS